jgi:tetratricopeptide (TPR) repeat protein
MTSPPQWSDVELDRAFAAACDAELAGDLPRALHGLAAAVDHLADRGESYPALYAWRARLHVAMGQHQQAEATLQRSRELCEHNERWTSAFRLDVAAAEAAVHALDLPKAALLLARLRGDGQPLGPAEPPRCTEIIDWLSALRCAAEPQHNLAVLRCEVALTLAGLWAERGAYRSALRLLAAIEDEIPAAKAAIRCDQVRLFAAELLIDAGQLDRAHRALAEMSSPPEVVDQVRIALVRARLGLSAGSLAESSKLLATLARAPLTEPALFASAVSAQAAILVELNLWREAQRICAEAEHQLGLALAATRAGWPASTVTEQTTTPTSAATAEIDSPRESPWLSLIRHAGTGAAARGRSVLALWELPASHGDVVAKGRTSARPTATKSAELDGRRGSFTASWIRLVNQVLEALECSDLPTAAQAQAQLEALTAGVESELIALRVKLSAALLSYCETSSPRVIFQFLSLADQMRQVGARGDAAQATRVASWACARSGRLDHYLVLAQRATEMIDEIANELEPTERALYLMNKWNGRDEMVAARMRELLQNAPSPPAPSRRRRQLLCRTVREVDALTHWHLDRVFGEAEASQLLCGTSDHAAAWVREQLSAPKQHLRPLLRSPWGLWIIPRDTLLLHYHVLADRSYLFRLAHRHIDVRVVPLGRLQLAGQTSFDEPTCLQWLANHLGIADALHQFPNIRNVVLIAHGELSKVPFAALPYDGQYLCERVAIRQLDRLDRFQRRARWRLKAAAACFGLDGYAGSGYPSLLTAEQEAAEVATLLPGTAEVRTGDSATCEALLLAMQRASLLHVAAHGQLDSSDPARGGIVLRDGHGHRTVTLHELRRLKIKHLQLATLATCRAAESAVLPGGSRLCLPAALLDAGVQGVIASLWPILDHASPQLMNMLYRRLRTERPSVALAATQAAMSHQPNSQLVEWAGLVYYGND